MTSDLVRLSLPAVCRQRSGPLGSPRGQSKQTQTQMYTSNLYLYNHSETSTQDYKISIPSCLGDRTAEPLIERADLLTTWEDPKLPQFSHHKLLVIPNQVRLYYFFYFNSKEEECVHVIPSEVLPLNPASLGRFAFHWKAASSPRRPHVLTSGPITERTYIAVKPNRQRGGRLVWQSQYSSRSDVSNGVTLPPLTEKLDKVER